MTLAIYLDIVWMDHIENGSDHLRGGVGADIFVSRPRMEIKMDTKEALVPTKSLLSSNDVRAEE